MLLEFCQTMRIFTLALLFLYSVKILLNLAFADGQNVPSPNEELYLVALLVLSYRSSFGDGRNVDDCMRYNKNCHQLKSSIYRICLKHFTRPTFQFFFQLINQFLQDNLNKTVRIPENV